MSTETFSRSFLQRMPEQHKQQHIDSLINVFIHDLRNAAIRGKTSYMYDLNNRQNNSQFVIPLSESLPRITNDDLVSAFQQKFPDCNISYQETWINVNSNNKVLKKGIMIDWS